MPFRFLDEAYRATIFLINWTLTPILKHKSPIEVLFKTPPIYSQLKVFGYLCFPNTRPYNCYKRQFRYIPCTFIGYNLNHKGYKCLDASEIIFYISWCYLWWACFSFCTIFLSYSVYFLLSLLHFPFFLLLLYLSNLFSYNPMLLITIFYF